MKIKKVLVGLGAAATALAMVPLFAAFEAHVINVTARIENALEVPVKFLEYGTVFPQEYLLKNVPIRLSQSFLTEDRVDDVEYIIRQKPKCAITWLGPSGWEYDNTVGPDGTHIYTATGHVTLDPVDVPYVDCGPAPRQLDASKGEIWGPLPLLCPYLSKHEDTDDGSETNNDGSMPAFHEPYTFVGHQVVWNDVKGRLSKLAQDIADNWVIDLAVPCFGGYCAQDWAEFVHDKNPYAGDPAQWVQPIENEHKVFGCDIWIEVGGISLPPGLGCDEELDAMLVLDRSGSISAGELATLQAAAKAFVDALAPSADTAHIGEVSFSTSASLDIHLTDNGAAVKAAIDALSSGGFTNLQAAIDTAKTELDNPGDGHDRADGASPDYMIIITDGAPTTGGDSAAAAAAAKAAGIKIYVVGVGVTADTETFLKGTIATSPDYYFSATDFDQLQTILEGLVSCE